MPQAGQGCGYPGFQRNHISAQIPAVRGAGYTGQGSFGAPGHVGDLQWGHPFPGLILHPGWGGAVPGALSLLTICPCGPRRGLRGDNPGWEMLGQDGEVYLNCSIEASDTENAAKTKMNKVPCALQMSARDKSRVVYHLGKYGHHQYV